MREPLLWAGVGVVIGAASWPWWEPPLWALVGVSGALGAAAALWTRAAPALFVAGAILLGAGAAAALPAPVAVGEEATILGEVRRVSGRTVYAETDAGPLALLFPMDTAPPAVGRGFAARTVPMAPASVLPGEPDPATADRRAHRGRRRVRSFVTLGPPSPPPPDLVGARHAGLLRALTTGDRSGVPEETSALLRDTGTSHLLAISGLHVGLVAGAAWGLAALLSRPLALLRWPLPARLAPALAGVAAAVAYAGAVGWPVSATRAVWMAVAAALARLLGRPVPVLNLLGLAACAVVLMDPGQVSEPGFLLSFGSVLGIALVAPRLTRLLPPDTPRPLTWVAGSLAVTLGATAGTLPIAAWQLQQLSPVSPLANLVAGPLVGAVALPAALVGMAAPDPLAGALIRVADGALSVTLSVLEALRCAPWAPAVGPGGAALLAGAVLLRRWPVAAGVLAAVALGLRPVPRGLELTFLAIGQGDAAVVRWADGRTWLFDGGPPSRRLLQHLRREGVRTVDAVFLSHPDADHLGGLLAVMESLPVKALWTPRPPKNDELAYQTAWDGLAARGVPVYLPGDAPPDGARVLHPGPGWEAGRDDNDDSLVVEVALGARRFLFTGDIEAPAEAWLGPHLGPVDVVKVPHHGSRSSSTAALVDAARPRFAVISCGAGNPFGHPSTAALDAWRGARILRTDLDGSIRFHTDGVGLTAEAWLPGAGWRGVDEAAEGVVLSTDGQAALPSTAVATWLSTWKSR